MTLTRDALPVSNQLPRAERLRLSIELTNICNFTCPFCPQAHKGKEQPAGSPYDRRQGRMADEVFERALAEAERVAETVELGFFGEQTLHPRYAEFLRRMKTRSFGLELNTNISFLTDDMMDAWVEAQVDMTRLSLDAVTPEVFDRARPGQVRDLAGKVVPQERRLAALHEKVERWLARPDHTPTRLVFVKSSWNEGEHDLFLEYWLPKLGPDDYVLMKQVLSYGGKTADKEVQGIGNCNVWDMRFLMIDWQGNLSPCNLDTNMDLKIGNIMDDSVETHYRGAVADRLRGLTGCGGKITPCSTCTDGNNWSQNETHSNPKFAAASAQLAPLVHS
ncbi:MAG: organic radical activating enzyme [Paracoccaceae bacterium]|jgi:organic radical activating enzyme